MIAKFLGASKRPYNSLRWSVGALVRWLVGPYIASPRKISRLVCYTTCLKTTFLEEDHKRFMGQWIVPSYPKISPFVFFILMTSYNYHMGHHGHLIGTKMVKKSSKNMFLHNLRPSRTILFFRNLPLKDFHIFSSGLLNVNRLQEAVTAISTLMPRVKGFRGLGGGASVPKGADAL
jgi:hypothetical protein